jgi:hypothetical protein
MSQMITARDALETLTTDELCDIHTSLCMAATALHEQMMDENGEPRISVFSEAWEDLNLRCRSIAQVMYVVHGVVRDRAAKAADHA